MIINIEKIFEERNKRLDIIREDKKNLKASLLYYKENPVDFINHWGITYDPRKQPSLLPFVLFERQKELIEFIMGRYNNKEDGLIEKSRDMGVTWVCMALGIWMWLFIDGVKVAFGSWKQEKLDRLGDNDSIFEKGRMYLRYLPNEFLPTNFNEDKDCNFLKFINRDNGSTITGEAGENIGRGGRSTIYFKDESAFYLHPDKVESALSQNTDVQIDLSTPNGTANPFYEKRVGGKIPVFTFHWRDNPFKSKEWYEKEKEKRDPVIIAQELDIDYSASVEGICIPAIWVQAAIELDIPKEGSRRAGLDVADDGKDSNAQCITHGVVVEKIDEWSGIDTTRTARKAFFNCKDNNIADLYFDSIGVVAGVRGELSNIDMEGYELNVFGVNVGESPSEDDLEEDKKNKDMFLNLKAELWWSVRRKFEKTYQYVNKKREYPIDELISIPNDPQLIRELSQPTYKAKDNGKIIINKSPNNSKSPNKADALILSFSTKGKPIIFEKVYSLDIVDAMNEV